MADLHFLANPARFRRFSQRVMPSLSFATVLALLVGLYFALVQSPPDYQQGETVRIMFVHVPSAWLSMAGYGLLAVLGASLLVWRHPLAALMARAAAPVGACFALVCLLTGSLWGRPMWGTYWVWDARLTSMLLLFFLYLGHIALSRAYDDPDRGDRAAAILALVGAINLPIIKFSVDWWNTLHQPASVLRIGGPTIALSMLAPLLVMATGFLLFFLALLMLRMRTALNERRALALRLNAGAAPVLSPERERAVSAHSATR
jgi:heme exporter protein C